MEGLDLAAATRAARTLLSAEVDRMRERGIPVGEDDLRGLYIPDEEANRILASERSERRAGADAAGADELVTALGARLHRLTRAFALTGAEAAVVGLCLVSEVDPEIERLIAYVQDDISKKRIRVELALRLFFGGEPAEVAAFDFNRPLRKHHLIGLFDEPGQPVTPMLSRWLALEHRVARYLLGSDTLDEALASTAELRTPASGGPPPPLDPQDLRPPVLSVRGTDLTRVRRTADSLAAAAGLQRVLELKLVHAPELPAREQFELAAREAALGQAALVVRGLETLDDDLRASIGPWLDGCVAPLTMLVTGGEPPWPGPSVTVAEPGFDERLSEWCAALESVAHEDGVAGGLPALAGKFELDTTAIEAAVRTAAGLATSRSTTNPLISVDDLYAAARARSAPILSTLARKVTEQKGWDDLILEPDPLAQLHEICGMVEHRHRVYDDWGFGRKLSSGKGVVSLFAGQSGTGKTMAAGVIARELGLDLYRIDLSGVVSKYIGETEKNLGAIFKDASLSNAILFFDEADALFGKRSEVKDAHDRYANIETAYLLQQVEEYAGPVVLSTNLKMNLDEAFLRRMHFVVDFPMPEEPYRLRIWQTTIPREMPLADDADLSFLARQFRISGGNIRNIVLAAAFLGAADGDVVGMKHLVRATRREFQKLGRMVTEADFGEHLALLD